MFRLLVSIWRDGDFVGSGFSLVASWVIAEVFYKFHSFTLECLAFLATWFVVDAAATGVRAALMRRKESRRPQERLLDRTSAISTVRRWRDRLSV